MCRRAASCAGDSRRRPGCTLGAESGISKSEVSRICAGLDEMVEAFGAGASIMSSSPTSIWTRPISRCATASARSPRWRWSWPPASPPTATARSWDATSATARARGSGSTHPHRLIGQRVRDRVGHAAEADRGAPRDLPGSPRAPPCKGPRAARAADGCSSVSISTGGRRVTRWTRAFTSAVNASQASTSSAPSWCSRRAGSRRWAPSRPQRLAPSPRCRLWTRGPPAHTSPP